MEEEQIGGRTGRRNMRKEEVQGERTKREEEEQGGGRSGRGRVKGRR